jgi:hypothetical protein
VGGGRGLRVWVGAINGYVSIIFGDDFWLPSAAAQHLVYVALLLEEFFLVVAAVCEWVPSTAMCQSFLGEDFWLPSAAAPHLVYLL